MGEAQKSLAWAHGSVMLQALGGMIGPSVFVLPDGHQVSPFHIAPWFAEDLPPDTPAILQGLRGEWPCVPFGSDAPRALPVDWRGLGDSFNGAHVPHGHSAHVDWTFATDCTQSLEMSCDYPASHPIRQLRRSLRPDPKAAAIDISLTISARRACRLPIGLHPTFRLPRSSQIQLCPPAFDIGRTFPLLVEPTSRIAPNITFHSLNAIPTISGGTTSLEQLPLPDRVEELVQLCGVTGDFLLRYPDEGFQTRLSWNCDQFPSLLLWVSNQGRDYAPWNSRHLALGVEPVCAAFDLGPAISNAANPIADAGVATTMAFTPQVDFTTHYRIAVEPLGPR